MYPTSPTPSELLNARYEPFAHQVVGVNALLEKPYFLLADEMGAGKTKQVIDAAQILWRRGIINQVLVIAPASVRAVWFDKELGELAKHLWFASNGTVIEIHARTRGWSYGNGKGLDWFVTNYEFIRQKDRLEEVLTLCNEKTLLVLDESSAVKSHKAKQTKACTKIRRKCGRVILLNGTPIANNPGDLYSQSAIMNPSILNCASYFHFRARYAVMGGYLSKQIVKWVNLKDLQHRLQPYVLRRLKTDCLDLPEKLPSVPISATLKPETWKLYKDMREELIAWLDTATVSTAPQAVVRALRLAQLTSGFIGGVTSTDIDTDTTVEREVSREKLDVILNWIDEKLIEDPNIKLLIWCRWRAELARLYKELAARTEAQLGVIWGGQHRTEREEALRLLDPRTAPDGPAIVMGTPSSGSMGLNLAGAHTVVYLSNDYSLKTRLQSEDRVHRPGQTHAVSYFDVIATGPQGQKTIDHAIIKALMKKEEIATWTTSAWVQALREE